MAFITLSRKAFFKNLDIISERIEDRRKIALVLKDNAYGHGLIPIAGLAREYGIVNAVVRSEEEARQIVDFFEQILVLDDTPHTPHERISYSINELSQIARFPKGSRVELKVDTGMHRNGIAPDELEAALDAIHAAGLTCKGVFTHYRSADTLSSELFWQRRNFETIKARVRACHLEPMRFHSANSAALFRGDFRDEAMVRVGIAAYGCLQLDAVYETPPLEPVLALWGSRQSTRRLQMGARIGYNATVEVHETTEVSTYDVGYADGLLRSASNRYSAPDGSKLMGRISMDNCSFTCKDELLCIFDNANTFAAAAGSIGYEVLVGLPARLERRLIP